MMRALYSGVSGLRTHQTKMDVIGNNIANVNTVAYKSQTVTFQDLMYQTTQAASGANATTGTGGTNAKQIGLGVTTGAISTTITTAGATQTTNNPFDIKITGDSFFVVSDGTQRYFTKAGNFTIDSTGNLIMSTTGYNVLGWQVNDTTGEIQKATVSPLKVMATENLTSDAEATTLARYTGIVDSDSTDINSTAGEVANLDIYDSLGYKYNTTFSMHNAEGLIDSSGNTLPEGTFYMVLDDITEEESGDSVMTSSGATFGSTLTFTDSSGNTVTANNAVLVTYDPDNSGKLSAVGGTTGATTTELSFGTGTGQLKHSTISIDLSTSQMSGNSGTTTAAMKGGDADGNGEGRKLGKMIGISIGNDGKISGSYSNNDTKLLGQIAVAEFSNAAGLSKEGENLYAESLNSGSFDGIGVDVTANSGSMATGVLEMSNVDLSSEFTEMITTQRGFQANSRIITVSDTLIEELVNLKR
ncbi:hypothetical protein CG709_06265 [Lachnotalea glycerini]|nr:hypothetical protein CG709_06265 [Lachnotalea glycerini]